MAGDGKQAGDAAFPLCRRRLPSKACYGQPELILCRSVAAVDVAEENYIAGASGVELWVERNTLCRPRPSTNRLPEPLVARRVRIASYSDILLIAPGNTTGNLLRCQLRMSLRRPCSAGSLEGSVAHAQLPDRTRAEPDSDFCYSHNQPQKFAISVSSLHDDD
ncbi:hypothetical protein KL948_005078 [Ogataea haglerorum]|uniref:Uncharacterized protein n=1 Tax=Ogataea haglerorum TaxID=1937702 RepID=A0ABQ7RA05_9ASCO|nr:hypothetical protein KL950_005127 [Ogataea haglerorum]KAG7725165.1 hypothetical protein KL948_005078 [Ogataea haglerorum]KAG7733552.1 hypothetical protein KL932_005152 [Ogataea haglerorum]KAG7735985.1 hypothetical protein KL923_005087 [Ogataea haglerorum]KAG7754206.1 hypothetical protein KL947_005016 [Ogataea haglerorum]